MRYRYDRRRKPAKLGTSLFIIVCAAIVFAWILATGSGKIWPPEQTTGERK